MSSDNELIWEAIDNYFEHASDNRQTNIQLAQPAIKRWDNAFIVGLCSWVAESIEKEGAGSVRESMMGMSDVMLNLKLFSLTKRVFGQWADIVSTLGGDAGKWLSSAIVGCFDEDERALNALMLANNFIGTIENPMHLEMSRLLIEVIYKDTEGTVGTSCKMSLAWVLYNMNNKKPWEELVFGGHFVKPEHLPFVSKLLKGTDPSLSDKEIKDMICKWYAAPYIYPVEALDMLTSIPQRWGILEILALDLASSGRQFSNYPNWQRKSKS